MNYPDSNLLKGKVCLVTGSNKGIGKAIIEAFAAQGAIVYANARERGSLDELSLELSQSFKTKVLPVYFDVTDHKKAKEVMMMIKKEHKRLGVLVNNAGQISYEVLGMVNFDNLRQMMEVNVLSVINLMQLGAKLMQRQKSGSIINISSMVGEKGTKGQLGYSATKGAVIALTKSASKELAPYNIKVNTIAPGMVATDRFKKVLEEKFSDKSNDIGFGRLGEPSEVANSCVFLASDLSSYITGQVLGVEGSLIL